MKNKVEGKMARDRWDGMWLIRKGGESERERGLGEV